MNTVARGYSALAKLFTESDKVQILYIGLGSKPGNAFLQITKFSEDDLESFLNRIDEDAHPAILYKAETEGASIVDKHHIFHFINFEVTSGDNNYLLKRLEIKSLGFTGRNRETVIECCKIGRVLFGGHATGEYVFKNSKIGKIEFSASHFEIEIKLINCKILQLNLPKNVKIYSFFSQGCEFASKNIEIKHDESQEFFPKVDRQAYSNLRNWAEEHSDGRTAHIARAAELAAETHEEQWGSTKLMLWLWRIFGNYGLSPFRPLAWLALFWVLMAGALFITGTEMGLPTGAGAEIGWRTSLTGENPDAKMFRAAIAAFNSAINPFSVFSVRNLIVPKDSTVAILMPIHGLISIGLILLTGFSLRRRLKLV